MYSLFVLGNFYVVYAIVKASFDVHDNSVDDEQRFVQSCFCSLNQRFFYRFWFYFCFTLWFLIHSYSFVTQISVKRLHQFEDIMKVFLAFCIVCPCYCLKSVCKCLVCKSKEQSSELDTVERTVDKDTMERAVDKDTVDKDNIKLARKNISLLWLQYCKLYVIGYTKYYDKIQSIKIAKNNKFNENNGTTKNNGCCFLECKKRGEDTICTHPCCCLKCSRQCCSLQCENESEPIDICPEINITCCNEYFPNRYLSKDIIRTILFAVKYFSQLVTVPLLLLQIFDTYSFLCFSPDSYCSHTTEYKQHVVQAAITLFFYCSLVISHLTSTLLIWNPWPKSNEQSNPAHAPTWEC